MSFQTGIALLPGVLGHLVNEGWWWRICQLPQAIQYREFQLQLDAIHHGFEADFNVVEFVLGCAVGEERVFGTAELADHSSEGEDGAEDQFGGVGLLLGLAEGEGFLG